MKKALFFSPFSFIWSHALPELSLIKSLVRDSYKVGFVKCDKLFSNYCICMGSISMNINTSKEAKANVCLRCIKNASIVSGASSVIPYSLNNYISEKDRLFIDHVCEEIKFGSNHNFDFTFEGINFSRICMYEIILKFKLRSNDLDAEQFEYYKASLKNGLLAFFSSKKIISEFNPDLVVIYSPQYGVNNSVASYCMNKSIPVYFTEGSDNIANKYKSLRLWRWDTNFLVNPAKRFWSDYKDVSFGQAAYATVTKHIAELFQANSFSVYSAGPEAKFVWNESLGIIPGKKVVLLALSSHDEAYAAYYIGAFPREKVKSRVFKDQIEWVKSTISYFEKLPDVYLIIRVHPRDFTNKRETVISPQFVELQEIFNRKLPNNIIVNWPSDNISLYNIFPNIDLLLAGWSVTSLEAGLFKVPVVLYDKHLPSYPADVFLTGESADEYFKNIDFVLSGHKIEYSYYKVYQWWALNFYLSNLHIRNILFSSKFMTIKHYIFKVFKKMNLDSGGLIKRLEAFLVGLDAYSHARFIGVMNKKMDCLLDINLPENKSLLEKIDNASKTIIDQEMEKNDSYLVNSRSNR